jgi:hypothetical protein
MPSPNTFSIPPIAAFCARWLPHDGVIIDPFARDSLLGTVTNDLNPETKAQYHMEAVAFCRTLVTDGLVADAALFDPPYSPRQISEVYAQIGSKAGTEETQNARLYKAVRDGLDGLLRPGGIALSFGWNSAGFGKGRGYEIEEILLIAHGGAHNDTICVAERKMPRLF